MIKKTVLLNTALVLGSILFAYLLVEVYVRARMHDRYVNARAPMAVSHQIPVAASSTRETMRLAWASPNTDVRFWRIDQDSRIVFKTYYHANNLGLISRRDQPAARQAGEFRIVVIGDSFTAAIEMETPWTDILEDALNADARLRDALGVKRIRVYNFGFPSGGFLDFKRLAESARAVHPDLVVVNFIEADFHRCNTCFEDDAPGDARPPLHLVSGQIPIPLEDGAGTAKVGVTCESPPVSFSNTTCRHSFTLDAPPSVVENPEKLKALKQRIIREYVHGQLWLSPYPYALLAALGKPVSLSELRNPEKFAQKPRKAKVLSDNDKVAMAAAVLSDVRDAWPRTLFTHHPVYEDLIGTGTDNLLRQLRAADPSLDVVDMRKYLPKGLRREAYYSWFCLPADGHMGQKGGQVYAEAMARAVRNALLADKPD